jgi:acetyl esterase/lipase
MADYFMGDAEGFSNPLGPDGRGETMHAALLKAGVPASFVRIEGAGHGFSGADVTHANAEMVRWFEQQLRGVANKT